MKQTVLLLGVLLLLFSCTEEKEAEKVEIATYTIEQFMENESVLDAGLSPDNSKLLLTSNRSGIYNIYTVPTTGGEFTQITNSDSTSVFAISYFPNDDRILFRMDDNGNEVYTLYVRDGEEIKALTPAENARALFYGWSRDGNSFYYGSNQRDSRYTDIYQMDIETFTPTLIYENNEAYDFGGISNSGKYLALGKFLNTNDSDLFLYDLEEKELTKVNRTQSGNRAQDFSADDRFLYYTTDAAREFSYLVKYNIDDQTSEIVFQKDWDILGMKLSHDDTYMAILVNEDAKNVIETYVTETKEKFELPDFENAYVTGVDISRDEEMAILKVGGSHTPTNLYSMNMETKEATKLTDVMNEEIDQNDMVTAEVIRYASFDGLEIPALYYKPINATAENPSPALVWVHGGPGGQSRQTFSPFIQYLVNHGYAVLAVNNRGSSGYGKTFFRMDDQNHGEKDLMDCIEGKNWLAKQPEINKDQIGIIGGSYGGFMTMAALAFHPEEFEVGVNIFGVTNWLRTLRSIPPWWETQREALYMEMGDPATEDTVRLRKISPLFHAQNVTKPLIVLQGAKDPRVLQAESDEIVQAVKEKGVPVEYVLFEDEGHGFVKKENQIEAYERILQFLDKYLKGTEETEAAGS